jgi:hypothetical protein
MVKKTVFFLLLVAKVYCFEKLPSAYQVSYGREEAPVHVVEYFSFICPKCLRQIREEFGAIRAQYIDSGKVHWVFHPDPADKLTLQAMICMEKLDEGQKRQFLEVMAKNLDGKGLSVGCTLMQVAMEHFQRPIPELGKMEFLETTAAFHKAFAFLKQEDVVQSVPTVEINGRLCDEFPNRKFLEKQFLCLLRASCK